MKNYYYTPYLAVLLTISMVSSMSQAGEHQEQTTREEQAPKRQRLAPVQPDLLSTPLRPVEIRNLVKVSSAIIALHSGKEYHYPSTMQLCEPCHFFGDGGRQLLNLSTSVRDVYHFSHKSNHTYGIVECMGEIEKLAALGGWTFENASIRNQYPTQQSQGHVARSFGKKLSSKLRTLFLARANDTDIKKAFTDTWKETESINPLANTIIATVVHIDPANNEFVSAGCGTGRRLAMEFGNNTLTHIDSIARGSANFDETSVTVHRIPLERTMRKLILTNQRLGQPLQSGALARNLYHMAPSANGVEKIITNIINYQKEQFIKIVREQYSSGIAKERVRAIMEETVVIVIPLNQNSKNTNGVPQHAQ